MRSLIGISIRIFLLPGAAFMAASPQKVETPEPAAAHFVLDRTLKTPSQPIRGMAFGGEPPTIAALEDDGYVRMWNTVTGESIQTIELAGRPKSVSAIAFSPDGKWLVVGESFTKTEIFTAKIELLNAATGREDRTLTTHHWEVESLAFSRDGKWLVSSNWDRAVRLQEFPSGNQAREFESPSKPRCAAISPDAKQVASGGADGTVTLWDATTGKVLNRLSGHSGEIAGVAFSPDGQHLASASTDGSARLWSVSTGQWLFTLAGHIGPVLSVAYNPDGSLVATGGADDTVRIWDAATGQCLEALGAHSNVWQVAFSPDGRYLAAGYADGTINLWKKKE